MSRQLEEFDRAMLTYLRGGHVDWPSNLRNSMTGDLLTDHHRLLATRYNLFGPNILPAELSREAIEQHAWGRARRSGQQDLIAGVPSCEMHPTLRRVLGGGIGDYGPRHHSYELDPYRRGRSRDVNELVVRRRSRSRHRSHSRHHHHHSHHHDHHRSASAHRRLGEERYAADRHRQQEINVQAELLRRANEVRDARRREADFERMRTEQMAIYERKARDRDAWVSGQRRRVNDRIREYNTCESLSITDGFSILTCSRSDYGL